MIERVARTLVQGGVDDIMVLLNGRWAQPLMEILENGARFGCEISYKYIQGSVGAGQELLSVENWVGKEDFVVMLADSLFLSPLNFKDKAGPHIWTMPLNGQDDPTKYGQVAVRGRKVVDLWEKPTEQKSNIIQTAVWLFPPEIFEAIRQLQAKSGEEIGIGQLSEHCFRLGWPFDYTELPPRSYLDLGTPDALQLAASWAAARA